MDYLYAAVKMVRYLTITEILFISKSTPGQYNDMEDLTVYITEYWNIFYVEAGSIDILYKNKTIPLSKGDVFHIEPNVAYMQQNQKDVLYYKYTFAAQSSVLDYLSGKKLKLPAYLKKYIYNVFDETCNSYFDYRNPNRKNIYPKRSVIRSSVRPCWQQYICQCLEFIIIELIRKYAANETHLFNHTQGVKDIALRIAKFLEANIYNHLTLANVCDEFKYSKVLLLKEFRAAYGSTIMNHFNMLKINEAKKLITEKNHTFNEIADMLQFVSEKYFAVVFKRYTNISPSVYKSKVKLIEEREDYTG